MGDGFDHVPSWVSFATEAEYSAELVNAVSWVVDDAYTSLDVGGLLGGALLSSPVATQVIGLKTAFEQSTGVSFGQLVNLASSVVALGQSSAPSQIAQATTQLIMGALDIAKTVASAMGVATSALNVIPILGQIVAVMGIFASEALKGYERRAENTEKCRQAIASNRNDWCADLIRNAMPIATGRKTTLNPSGLDPSDLFRSLAYEWQNLKPRIKDGEHYGFDVAAMNKHSANWVWNHYRPSVAVLYLGLCGRYPRFKAPVQQPGQKLPAGMPKLSHFALWPQDELSHHGYHAWCQRHGVEPIPANTQRKMWQLVKGLMAGVRDPRPTLEGPIQHADGGRALMPILHDLVHSEHINDRVPPELLWEIQYRALRWTQYRMCCEISNVAPLCVTGRCAERWQFARQGGGGPEADNSRIDLVTPFLTNLDEYTRQLQYELNVPSPAKLTMAKAGPLRLVMPDGKVLTKVERPMLSIKTPQRAPAPSKWRALWHDGAFAGHVHSTDEAADILRAAGLHLGEP